MFPVASSSSASSPAVAFAQESGTSSAAALSESITNLLTPDFVLTSEWIMRLHQIASTLHDPSVPAFGICGTCMFQAVEMLLNLAIYQNAAPKCGEEGLLFSPYLPSSSPLRQFKFKYPDLYQQVMRMHEHLLLDIVESINSQRSKNGPRIDVERKFMGQIIQIPIEPLLSPLNIKAIHNSVLPPEGRQPILNLSRPVLIEEDLTAIYQDMMQTPVGSLWLVVTQGTELVRSVQETSNTHTPTAQKDYAHAILIIHHPDGLGFIPTNSASMSLGEYSAFVNVRVTVLRDFLKYLQMLNNGGLLFAVSFFKVGYTGFC